jgi:hypothetical protein
METNAVILKYGPAFFPVINLTNKMFNPKAATQPKVAQQSSLILLKNSPFQ